MTAVAPQAAGARSSVGADARAIAGRLLVGTAAGSLAGILVGGIGGRLAMLALRLLSDPIVIGVTSDDGFEIGRVTLGGSFQLAGAMAALGAANGVLYALVRDSLPRRARAPLWSLFAAAVGGSQILHEDGVDFTLLEPLWFAVAAFVALPGVGALVVVLLVERWLGDDRRPPHPVLLGILAAAGTVALTLAALAAAAVLTARRLRLSALIAGLARIVVPLALVVGILAGAWYTIDEAVKIL